LREAVSSPAVADTAPARAREREGERFLQRGGNNEKRASQGNNDKS